MLCFCRFVIVGGGNATGYAARTFVENGMADGRLCIVSKEVSTCLYVMIECIDGCFSAFFFSLYMSLC